MSSIPVYGNGDSNRHFYRLQTKFGEGNVFTEVCLSTGVEDRGRGMRLGRG